METTEILIYGASGHGKVVADIARSCGYTVLGYLDDDPEKEALTPDEALKRHPDAPVALGIGDNAIRATIYESLTARKRSIATLIHPGAVLAESVRIGEGSVVMAGAVINPDALIERGAIINTGAIIEHDCAIDEFVHISPAAALAGGVRVAARAHVGIGASIIQGIRIGEGSIVGAGAAVIRDVDDACTVAGVPAREITRG